MSPLALTLVLGAAVFHSAWNLALKSEARRLLWAFLVQTLDALLLLIVLRARGNLQWPQAGAPRWRAAAIGVLMLASYLAILNALTLAPVSYVVAGREVSIVMTALAGALLLHERHSRRRVAGALVIFAGLVVLALSR